MNTAIAIVGMACIYPDAPSPAALWENVLAQRQAFRRLPAERLNLADYWSADHAAADRTYATEAALIEGYEFDRVRFRVAGSTFRSADLAHWLALDVAAQALANAGYGEGEALPRATTGVLLGNTLTGEFSRANVMRLRWPYVRRTVDNALAQHSWSLQERRDFLDELESQYKEPFAPIGEESLAGGLSNTIAGRICNYFNLNGGGYTVDGACASSLLAITNACVSLAGGDLDVALAGGVDLSLDPFELVGFAKTQALAPEQMRVYDIHSAGFWPGEGCGFVVLMRLADALAEKRTIRAVIRGWGVSSDGSGGITRPEVDGQLLAVERAYRRAGFGPETVAYFEGHGTGTTVGDMTELRMLNHARQTGYPQTIEPAHRAVISSVKTIIGHTKAAAGVAGLIKATMALEQQILPPTTGCEQPHPELCTAATTLRTLSAPEAWPTTQPLRAGVSAMGFGGINSHIVLTGYNSDGPQQLGERKRFTAMAHTLSATPQDAELFLFSAHNSADLQTQLKRVHELVPKLSKAELTDLAAELQRRLTPGAVRAAIVAATRSKLTAGLQTLQAWLGNNVTEQIDTQAGLFLHTASERKLPAKIGFLFPGQGSPSYGDGGVWARRFDRVRDLYREVSFGGCLVGESYADLSEVGHSTAVAQPAIITASLAGLRGLAHLGISAECAVGHSLGELSALHWAGAFDESTLLRLATVRGRLMRDLGGKLTAGEQISGTMASIGTDPEVVTNLLEKVCDGDVTIACFNGPEQTVIAGPTKVVADAVACAQSAGLQTVTLPVAHAFHSSLMAPVVPRWREHLGREQFQPLQRSVISTISGKCLPQNVDIPALLQQQLTAPVRFTEAVTQMAASVDLLIEIGPGRMLAGLTRTLSSIPVIALDASGSSIQGLLQATAAAYVMGAPVNHAVLFADRFTRPLDLERRPRFFTNPCELAPVNSILVLPDNKTEMAIPAVDGAGAAVAGESVKVSTAPETAPSPQCDTLTLMRQLVAERVELPMDAINPADQLLSDLHLNSITVSQLVAEAARRLRLKPLVAPIEYANVTVADVAAALDELITIGDADEQATAAEPFAAGVDTWVHTFATELYERAPAQPAPPGPIGAWQVLALEGDPLQEPLQQALANAVGTGVVVCLPAQPVPIGADVIADEDATIALLLDGARCVAAQNAPAPRFVLVQRGRSCAAFARTLKMEMPHVTTIIVTLPEPTESHIDAILTEATAQLPHGQTHVEAHYAGKSTGSGSSVLQRTEPVLRLQPLNDDATALPLGPDDVLLVTGGGKGITAECALALAVSSGARLALIGRAQPATDEELASNLDRFCAAGIHYHYVATDITQGDAVRAAVAEITSTLGPITAILHGAARNIPKRLPTLTGDDFAQTLAPKIQGLRNLLAAIYTRPEESRLRLLVTFGSIIARTGLSGEADYGLANEWLVGLTTAVQQYQPSCRCLAIEWSVWAGAGMGDRLGTVERLRQQGIMPISLDEGIRILHRLLCNMATNRQFPLSVVVSGRMGEPPTVRMAQTELPFLRFLETVRVHYPGVELVVDCTLSAETDPYLLDHVYQGERLLPAVIGLEAMAQVAMTLAERTTPPNFEEVQFLRPVVVPAGQRVGIRLAALLRTSGQIEVVLRCAETNYQINHFRAICRFAANAANWPIQNRPPISRQTVYALEQPVHLDCRALYGTLLFHGERFQRLKRYHMISAKACVAEIATFAAAWFARYLPANLLLGDPGVRDAVIHAIQVCVPHATLLPVGVAQIVRHTSQPVEQYIVHAHEQSHSGDTFVYDVDVTGADGVLVEEWHGLTLRAIAQANPFSVWPTALLAPYLQRRVAELLRHDELQLVVEEATPDSRRERSNQALQHVLGNGATIRRRLDGRPEASDKRAISVAHTDDVTIAVALSATSTGAVGCDIEPVVARTASCWCDLLGCERFGLAQEIGQACEEPIDTAATRLWTVSEALHKIGSTATVPLTLKSVQPDGWVVVQAGAIDVVTCVVEVVGIDKSLALAFAKQGQSTFDTN